MYQQSRVAEWMRGGRARVGGVGSQSGLESRKRNKRRKPVVAPSERARGVRGSATTSCSRRPSAKEGVGKREEGLQIAQGIVLIVQDLAT